MARRTGGYNADQKQNERKNREFVIGGEIFVPAKKSRKLMRELISSAPRGTDDNDPQVAQENIDHLYEQVRVLLVYKDGDNAGENPDAEFLDEELDFEEAGDIVGELMPENPQPPDKPQGTPTPA